MAMPNFKYNLFNKSGESATVVLCATVNRTRVRFSPGITVNPRYWDKKKQRLLPIANLDPDHPVGVNESLTDWIEIAENLYRNNPYVSGEDFTEALKQERSGEGKKGVPERVQKTLDGFALHYAEEKRAEGNNKYSHGTLVTSARVLIKFAAHRGRPIYWEEIDKSLLRKLKNFLENKELNFSQNQVANVFKRTKHFVKAAGPGEGNYNFHKRNITDLKEWQIKKELPYKQYLTQQELDQFLAYDLSNTPYLERQRDMFVLNAWTGLRRGDARRINRDNYYQDTDGDEHLKVFTSKTGKYILVPLHPVAKRILDKYDWELPVISDPNYNLFIKQAAERAGLTAMAEYTHTRAGKRITETYRKCDKLSSHDARRSFATNFYELGMPASVLMGLTGHSTEAQLLQYICTTPERKAKIAVKFIAKQFAKEDQNLSE